MADFMDLSHQDYRNLVQHCKECRSTLEIVTFINTKLKKYYKDNPDFVYKMQEEVEEMKIKEINYFTEDHQLVVERNISNFKLDTPKEKNIQLKYLYSYLCYLNDDHEEFDKIIGLEKIKKIFTADPLKSFNSCLTEKQLQDLSQKMVEEKIISRRDESMFVKIMSGVSLDEIRPVRWLPTYRNGSYMKFLFEIFKHLCENEYLNPHKTNNFFEKIQKCFVDSNGDNYELSNLRSTFSKRKEFDTQVILSKKDFHSVIYKFVHYLDEHKLLKLEQ